LLESPRKDFYPLKLSLSVNPGAKVNREYSNMSLEQLENEGLSITELPIDIIELEEKKALENMVCKAWGELRAVESEGRPKEIEAAQDRWNELKIKFLNEYGIMIFEKGNDLRFSYKAKLKPDQERIRKSISKHIKTILQDIKKEIPSLYEHLDAYIKTGNKFSYNLPPESPVKWLIIR
jgi:hypothetical protein